MQDIADIDLIFFDHMPKTGGTSLHFILEEAEINRTVLPLTVQRPSEGQLEEKRAFIESNKVLISGHYCYGLGNLFPGRSQTSFTILRDPIDRLISNFYWNAPMLFGIPSQDRETLDALFFQYVEKSFNANLQTAQLAGFKPIWRLMLGNAEQGGSFDENLEAALEYQEQYNESYILFNAKEYLQNFFFIGIYEYFVETLFILMTYLGSRVVPMWHKPYRHSYKRPRSAEMPKEIIQKIQHITETDQLIYDTYRQQLETMVASIRFDEVYWDYKKQHDALLNKKEEFVDDHLKHILPDERAPD